MSIAWLKKPQKKLENILEGQIKTLNNYANEAGSHAEQEYRENIRRLEKLRNFGYGKDDMKKILDDYVNNSGDRNEIKKILYKVDGKINGGREMVHGYRGIETTLDKIIQKKEQIEKDSVRSHGNKAYLQFLKEKQTEYNMKLSEKKQEIDSLFSYLNDLSIDGMSKIKHYTGKKHKENGSKLTGNLIATGLSIGVAGAALYAIAGIDASNFSTGAFVSGAAVSPMTLMLTIASVLFFLMLATHHKLE